MSFEKPAVVLDNGSYNIKAGFSCDNHPVSIFRTLVGRPNYLKGSYGREYYDVYIGDDATEKTEDLELNHPVVRGKIVHWDNMERIWHHVLYRELKVAPEDRAIILGCGPSATMEEKIKCCEIFFETLNAPAICIQSQSVLAMYGSGVTTGICVDLGFDTIDVMPVYEGGMIKYAHLQTGYAGSQISKYIKKNLEMRNKTGIVSSEDIESIKRNCLYVNSDFAASKRDFKQRIKYELPSGEEIDVSREAFVVTESIFQPNLLQYSGKHYLSLQDAIVTASLKCDAEIRTELYDAIVPCGGLACIPDINERLQFEITNLISDPITILSSPEPYVVSWLGGATFAGLSDAEKVWVQRKQYDDYGIKIIKNKFL